jgi:pterin-4a-carbinolamine dehydratase
VTINRKQDKQNKFRSFIFVKLSLKSIDFGSIAKRDIALAKEIE